MAHWLMGQSRAFTKVWAAYQGDPGHRWGHKHSCPWRAGGVSRASEQEPREGSARQGQGAVGRRIKYPGLSTLAFWSCGWRAGVSGWCGPWGVGLKLPAL